MKLSRTAAGHLAVSITTLIWGATFISTKILLRAFSPVKIPFIRFVTGYLALWLVCPHSPHLSSARQEVFYATAGFCDVAIYYLLRNIALTYTLTSNVGAIVSTTPFFAIILGWMFLGGEGPRFRFSAGFLLAMAGISLTSFGDETALSLNLTEDLLAMVAAAIWAVYFTLTKKINALDHGTVQGTRRTLLYGVLFMVPALAPTDFRMTPVQFIDMKNILNLLFLGLGTPALYFITQNIGVKMLGVVKTSIYICVVPAITTLTSILVLGEPVTVPTTLGIVMTLAGLFLSEQKTTGKGGPKIWATRMKNV